MFSRNVVSTADFLHLASELIERFIHGCRPLAASALPADCLALTSTCSDYVFDEVFARQVFGLGYEGDLLIGTSSSGNSRNVISSMFQFFDRLKDSL